MNGRKATARLNARRASFDRAVADHVPMERSSHYNKRPGSLKKPWPAGKSKTHGDGR